MAYNPPLQNLISSSGSLRASNRSSTSLLTPALSVLADPPTQHKVDLQLVHFVTHELIRILLESARATRLRHEEQQQQVEDELEALGLSGPKSKNGKAKAAPPLSPVDAERRVQDEDDAAVRARLDSMGYKAGWTTAERLAKDRPLFPTTPVVSAPSSPSSSSTPALHPDVLELVKFLCKEVWTAVYDKQVDNLRTNHRGVWVLLDNGWRPLRGMSRAQAGDKAGEREVQRWIDLLLAFPCGLIRGALANLGVYNVIVTGESPGGMQASFQIKTVVSGATPLR
ncbi:hypothetical protein JCM8547_008435 [Rhodosporidiobolus lusitaniae]